MTEKQFNNECLDFEFGFKGISRFTCYKPTYTIDEWENGEVIKSWDIMRVKEDYFAFLVYVNKIFNENKQLTYENNNLKNKLEKKNQYQQVLESKIVRLKDRVKTFEHNYGFKDIERYKKMSNPNMITHERLWRHKNDWEIF